MSLRERFSASLRSDDSPRRPSRNAVVAVLTALTLAVVGGVTGITLKQHKAPSGLQTISVGQGTVQSPTPKVTVSKSPAARSPAPRTTPTTEPAAARPTTATKPTTATTISVLAPLKTRTDPDLFLTSPSTITPAQIAAVVRTTGAIHVLQVDYAQVNLGSGVTTAVGVDPATFRLYTPANTAPVDALWQRVAEGDVAVAHAVGAALQVTLGGHTMVGRVTERDVRIGAFATSRLPGVGIVVDQSQSASLGLIPGAALIIALPTGADPIVASASAKELIPNAKVQALRYAVQSGLSGTRSGAGGPSGPTVPGGIPILGDGWTIPMALGSYRLSQRYHYPNGHPGIDLAAPFGTPIYAASEGDVLYWGPAQGFGNWIVLQHPGGIQTVYGHMRRDELIVGPNAHVKAGQLIARVGSEGESTGPHLHFEVRIDNQRTDPIAFLNAHGVTEIH